MEICASLAILPDQCFNLPDQSPTASYTPVILHFA